MNDIRDEILADPDAERALLGACLLSDLALEQAAGILEPTDFAHPDHVRIFAAMLAQRGQGRVDVVTLGQSLDQDALKYLHELQNATPSIGNAHRYAMTVADWKLRRKLLMASDQIAMLARRGMAGNAADAADEARALLQHLDLPASVGAPDPDVDSFIAAVPNEYDWLIPGFLERRDRMLVTASEGAGKSVLLAQIAVMAAAGIHPWKLTRVDPVNVLVIDLENGERLMSRRLRWVADRVDRSKFDPQRLRIHTRSGGIDLTTRSDRRWLLDRCRANATELLVIGPAYRMSAGVAERGDTGGEDHIRKVTQALDEVRQVCNVAMILETHAPHGDRSGSRDLRPFGSSVWLRWPEFGIGLYDADGNRRRYKLTHWRGPRDQRTWPDELEKGAGKWPWTPTMPTGTFAA